MSPCLLRLCRSVFAVPVLTALTAGAGGAQEPAPPPPGAIAGRVLSASGTPAAGAHITVVELRQHADADAEGRFRFEVPPGAYLVQAESARFGLNVARVEVAAGAESQVEIVLDLATHREVVVVTARGQATTLSDSAQAISVLSGTDLTLRREGTLGETVAQQPGVTSTYFGPGASRPVIRGLGGDRIRVLQDGIGTADASNTSPDHAVAYDPLSARQIEIVRGPATLLYGSNAVGGVVNVLDNRVPTLVPDRPLTGTAELSGGTVAGERMGGLSLTGGKGRLAWHADVLSRDTGDLDIPGFAESLALRRAEEEEGDEHEQEEGVLANSATESLGGAVGASLVGSRGFLGLALSGLDTSYGVPGGHGHGEEGEDEEGDEGGEDVKIDLQQRRADLRGELRDPMRGFRSARVRFGLSDYEHRELEGGAVGTTFTNRASEGRLELSHNPWGPASGTLGVQASRRDFDATGEEAFVPPTLTTSWALFAFEELGRGPLRGQLGLRYDHQAVEARGAERVERTSHGVSGSAGLSWKRGDAFTAGLTLARSVKLPTAEELFSNGPHLATRSFEVGDPDLAKEKSLGLDLSLRGQRGRVAALANVFANWFDRYIFQQFTGGEEDGLPVVRYVQGDARFHGAEGELTIDLLHAEPHHLDLELGGDYVRAELRGAGEDLPRIPPGRVHAGLHYAGHSLSARVEVRRVLEQGRVALFERPTDGYTLLNASLGYRLFVRDRVVDLLLRGTNLTDTEARNHVSFLKDLAPLPGRDLRASVRVTF